MKIVFVAGPFAGANAWEIEQNVRRAEALALEVARLGAMPITPHCNSRFFFGTEPESFWREGYRELLSRCDAMIVVSNWARSSGTQMEVAHAAVVGRPVFFDLESLRCWLTDAARPAPLVASEEFRRFTTSRPPRAVPGTGV